MTPNVKAFEFFASGMYCLKDSFGCVHIYRTGKRKRFDLFIANFKQQDDGNVSVLRSQSVSAVFTTEFRISRVPVFSSPCFLCLQTMGSEYFLISPTVWHDSGVTVIFKYRTYYALHLSMRFKQPEK